MKKTGFLSVAVFKTVRFLVRLFYGKAEIIGLENIPANDAVIVANHSQMNGPIMGELFMPKNCYIWCAGQMMDLKEVPHYAFKDFWSQKPRWTHPFFKLLSYIIAPLSSAVFNNARTIAVYRDKRVISTFKQSVSFLSEGKNLLIFPEKDEKYNNIIYALEENFIDIARLYFKKTKRELTFVPMYIAPNLKKAFVGEGIKFKAKSDGEAERHRICKLLAESITNIGQSLDEHIVVPYRNIPKKYYLSNKAVSEVPHEKAGR